MQGGHQSVTQLVSTSVQIETVLKLNEHGNRPAVFHSRDKFDSTRSIYCLLRQSGGETRARVNSNNLSVGRKDRAQDYRSGNSLPTCFLGVLRLRFGEQSGFDAYFFSRVEGWRFGRCIRNFRKS